MEAGMEQRMHSGGRSFFQAGLVSLAVGLPVLAFSGPGHAQAQILPDNTLGAESSVVLDGGTLLFIDGGATRGGNLFHSFEEFSVQTGNTVFFNNALNIQNILSRVTGSSASSIDGTIAAQGTANLFLLNPNGVVFGPNASLQVGGAFLATTADGLNFEDGFEFSAGDPQAPPLLTINAPIGLTFRGSPQPITNQSSVVSLNTGAPAGLEVSPGSTLALVGGDVTLLDGGRLTAPGGRVELGGLASEGTVGMSVLGDTITLGFQDGVQFGDVSLLDSSVINVRGQGDGDVLINADLIFFTNGSGIAAGTAGVGDGGDVVFNANTVSFFGTDSVGFGSAVFNVALPGSSGNAGDIIVNAQTVTLDGDRDFVIPEDNLGFETGFQSQTAPGAAGDAGNIIINAETFSAMSNAGARSLSLPGSGGGTGDVTVNAQSVNLSTLGFIEAVTQSEQPGGIVTINADTLSIANGSAVGTSTLASGDAGPINLNIDDQISITGVHPEQVPSNISSFTNGTGNAGVITVNTGDLTILNGATLGGSSTDVLLPETGDGGDVNVDANGSIAILGQSSDSFFPSRITTLTNSSGAAGNISLSADLIRVANGGSISAATDAAGGAGSITLEALDVKITGGGDGFFPSPSQVSIQASSSATGSAGSLTIDAERLSVRDGAAIFAGTLGAGNAGVIDISASESVVIAGEADIPIAFGVPLISQISTASDGSGGAGPIVLETERLVLRDGGRIIANTSGFGDAGDISISSNEIRIRGTDSTGMFPSGLSAILGSPGLPGVGNPTASGGDITLVSDRLLAQGGAEISVATQGLGNAGTIDIDVANVTLSGAGNLLPTRISASVLMDGFGNAGGIILDTNQLKIEDGATITADTAGLGSAGSIQVDASDITLSGASSDEPFRSSLSTQVNPLSDGDGGQIIVNTDAITVLDGAIISAATFSSGEGGDITINAEDQVLLSGENINDPEFIFVGSLSAGVGDEASGDGGSIVINTDELIVRNAADINVSSIGTGDPGDIESNANFLLVEDRGSLNASSATGQGGNIDLNILNILLRRQGQITAAGSSTSITTEGNIDIRAETLVLLEESQIITSSIDPEGGSNISILPLDGEDLVVLVSSDSLINAEGELVIAEELEADPPEVPELEVVDPAEQIAQNACTQGEGSEFVVTGRGGLPANPIDVIGGDATQVELVTPVSSGSDIGASQPQSEVAVSAESEASDAIVPAQGWVLNENDKVVLTAQNPTSLRSRQSHSTALCSPR